MNLYLINESSSGAIYGIGAYLRELIKALKNSSIRIHLIYLNSKKINVEIETVEGVNYWHIPAVRACNKLIESENQMDCYYRNVVYLMRLYMDDRDKPVFHLNYNHSIKLVEELKNTFDCRIVTAIHYFDWCLSLSGNVKRFRNIISSNADNQGDEMKPTIDEYFRKDQAFFRSVDKIICLSENTRRIVQDDYIISPDKLTVVYNGLSNSHEVDSKQALRQKYRIPDIPIILFAGRLNAIKGLEYGLRAFSIVLESLPDCRLIVIGNGSYDTYLKECDNMWTNITFTGRLEKAKLYDLYAIADIGVMPSFHEQCSYVAIEMMMHSLPVIGSTTTGLKEMIADGETGLHIPVVEYDDRVEIDTNLLAEKMLYLLQHPKERRRLGQNARKRYEAVYSAEVFRRNMTGFYSHLCKQEAKHTQSR